MERSAWVYVFTEERGPSHTVLWNVERDCTVKGNSRRVCPDFWRHHNRGVSYGLGRYESTRGREWVVKSGGTVLGSYKRSVSRFRGRRPRLRRKSGYGYQDLRVPGTLRGMVTTYSLQTP